MPCWIVVDILCKGKIGYCASVFTAVEDGAVLNGEIFVFRVIPKSSNIFSSIIPGHIESIFFEVLQGHESKRPGSNHSTFGSHLEESQIAGGLKIEEFKEISVEFDNRENTSRIGFNTDCRREG